MELIFKAFKCVRVERRRCAVGIIELERWPTDIAESCADEEKHIRFVCIKIEF